MSVTEDQALAVGNEAMTAHVAYVSISYRKTLMRSYLCGCLAVITDWLIKEAGPQQAFDILTEMAEIAIKRGNENGTR